MKTRSITWLSALVLAASLLGGCPTKSTVLVGTPQVFRRETLVKSRQREQQWLEEQLDRKVDTRYVGLHDLRTLEGFAGSFRGKYDPTSGAAAALQNQALAERLQADVYDARLEKLEARRRLDGARNPDGAVAGAATSATPAAAAGTGGGGDGEAPPAVDASGLPTPPPAFENTAPPDPNAIVKSKAGITNREEFHDALAYRDDVRGVIQDRQLDDVHDLRGMTLYTLSFDLSLLPGESGVVPSVDELFVGDRYALVRLALRDGKPSIDASFVRRTTAAIEDRFGSLLSSWQNRILAGRLGPDDSQVLDRLVGGAATLPSSLDSQLVTVNASLVEVDGDARPRQALDVGRALLARLERVLGATLGDTVTVKPVIRANLEGAQVVGVGLEVLDAATKAFAGRLEGLMQARGVSVGRVVSVEPHEYVQNVSEVAAQERFLDLALAVAASNPESGIGAEAAARYMKRSRETTHGVNRRPLLMGYLDGQKKFGWLFGPRFTVEDGQARYVHAPAHYSVSVSVAVPATWTEIGLSGKYGWLRRRGQMRLPNNLWDGKEPGRTVSLPGDPGAVASLILDDLTGRPHRPILVEVVSGAGGPVLVRNASDQTLLLRGPDLWRNPEVFVGSQKADSIEIHSDMRGLSARFAALRVPARVDGPYATLDVTVVTSEGSDTLRDAVKVLPAPEKAAKPDPAFATLDSRYLDDGGDLVFEVDPKRLPADRSQLELRIREKGTQPWVPVDGEPRLDGKRLLMAVKLNAPKAVKVTKPAVWEAQLRFRAHAGADPVSVLIGGVREFVYFPSAADRQFLLLTTSLTYPVGSPAPSGLVVNQPAHFALIETALPALKKALTDGKVLVRIMRKDDSARFRDLPLTKSGAAYVVAPVALPRLPDAHWGPASGQSVVYRVVLRYPVSDREWASLPMTQELTITAP